MPSSPAFEEASVRAAIDRLKRATSTMRLISASVVPAILVMTGSLLLGWRKLLQMQHAANVFISDREYVLICQSLAVLCSVGGLLLVIQFEAMRKHGDALFEEISNELQWYLVRAGVHPGDEPTVRDKPSIEHRITLRTFAQASDLPLVPGRYGPATYALLFLCGAVLSFLLSV